MGPERVLFKSVVVGALLIALAGLVSAPTGTQVSAAVPPISTAGATSTLTYTPTSASTPTSTGTPAMTPTGTPTPMWGCPAPGVNPASLHVPYHGGQYTIQVDVGTNCYWYDDPGISWLRYYCWVPGPRPPLGPGVMYCTFGENLSGGPRLGWTYVCTIPNHQMCTPIEVWWDGPPPPTPINTPTVTNTPTLTYTPTTTPVPSGTPTPTNTPTLTYTPTTTPTLANTPTSPPTSCSMPFTDVLPGDYFYAGVRYLYCAGAISGYDDGTFRPYNLTTRGQLAKIVVLAEAWNIFTPPNPTFSDVPTGNPFYQYVETAYSHNIISGYSCGPWGEAQSCLEYRPGSNVTRGQLCKVIVLAQRWQLYTPLAPTFQDVPAGNPFYAHVETAYSHHIISGYSCGNGCLEFRPGNSAARGQICKITHLAVTYP